MATLHGFEVFSFRFRTLNQKLLPFSVQYPGDKGHLTYTQDPDVAYQLTRAIFPASSSSVSLRSTLMLFTISRTKLQFNP